MPESHSPQEQAHNTLNDLKPVIPPNTPSQNSQHLYTVELPTEKRPTSPLFEERHTDGAPPWVRPFFSLRTQFVFGYALILGSIVVVLCGLSYQHTPPGLFLVTAIILVIVGAFLSFILTTLLLRPLWRVTDAAQAIAAGDLKQRERLPLRLPPQDEMDRLAGSINEMVMRLERAEEQQLDAEQHFRRFFSDASHQLRTPLTSLRGFTEVLLRGAKDDPETATRILKMMKSGAERMTLLINDLLTLARLDGSPSIKWHYVDVLAIATEELEKARLRCTDERTVSLSLLTQQRLGVQGDADRLKQLLFVLLDNALKYGRPTPDGIVKLQLDRNDSHILISIIDNGDGISEDDLTHIFDAFYRGQHKKSDLNGNANSAGTGLGLTIATAIVRTHEGSISVYSELNHGTTFTISLPGVD
jgi:two-component system OmpR family sensor kinase